MRGRLQALIADYRTRVKAALQQGDTEAALFLVRIICGFQDCLRMLDGPQRCAKPPPSFEIRS